MGLLDIHTVEKQHVEVNIQIERRSKTLDQGDRARLGHLVGMARFLDQGKLIGYAVLLRSLNHVDGTAPWARFLRASVALGKPGPAQFAQVVVVISE